MDGEIPLQPFVRSRMFNGHLWFEDEFADDYLLAALRIGLDVASFTSVP